MTNSCTLDGEDRLGERVGCNGTHTWTEILTRKIDYDIEQRLLWCSKCGAIRCDGFHDGERYVGKYLAERVPSNK